MKSSLKSLLLSVSLLFVAFSVFAAETSGVMLFDSHAHFISPNFDEYPLSLPAPPPGARQNPAQERLLSLLETNPPNAENIIQQWDEYSVVAGAGVQYRTAYGTDNRYLIDAAESVPQRIFSIVILDPLDPNTPYTLRSMVKDAGISGVRFTGTADPDTGEHEWLKSSVAQNTWAVADEMGIAIVLMPLPGGAPNPEVFQLIAENARKFPNVNIILDHLGWVAYSGAPEYGISEVHFLLQAIPNIYYKFSSINIEGLSEAGVPVDEFVRRIVDVFGADRIMWGSDYGNTVSTYQDMVNAVIDATVKLSSTERKQLLYETGKAVHVAGGRG